MIRICGLSKTRSQRLQRLYVTQMQLSRLCGSAFAIFAIS
ncbi:hypothetical protein P879_09524 [Paragonimus westermani]|uniref:Uncharacterized protein n=1 Tax=Paragonimus westermani TaxID=34504 RepID=A0A8T0D5L4_9TREM|nr:hypothetical protein P879_09524 [Paragonimus westermani]